MQKPPNKMRKSVLDEFEFTLKVFKAVTYETGMVQHEILKAVTLLKKIGESFAYIMLCTESITYRLC